MAKIQIPEREVQRARSANLPGPPALGATGAALAGVGRQLGAQFVEMQRQVDDAERKATVSSRMAQAEADLNTWFDQRASDPNGYKTLGSDTEKALGDLRKKAFDGVTDTQTQQLMGMRWDVLDSSARSTASSTARKQQIQYSQQETLNTIDLSAQNAANLPDQVARQRVVDDTLALIDGQVQAGIFSRPEAEKRKEGFLSDVQVGRLQNLIRTNPEQALRTLEGTKPIEHLTPQQRMTLQNQAQAEVNQVRVAREKVMEGVIADDIKALQLGKIPPNLDQHQQQIKGTTLEPKLALSRAQYEFTAGVNARPLNEQRDMIDKASARTSMTGAEADAWRTIESNYNAQVSLSKSDPMRYGVQKGLVRALDPLPFGDPAAMTQALAERRVAADIVSRETGRPAGPLYATEVDTITQQLDAAPVANQVDTLSALVTGLGSDAGGLLQQLNSSGADTYAAMGALARDGNTRAARELGNGYKTVQANSSAAPKAQDWQEQAVSKLGKAFEALPRTQADVIKQARLLYVGRGGDPNDISTNAMTQALSDVVGGFVDYGRYRTIPTEGAGPRTEPTYFGSQTLPAPAPGVTSTQFSDWLTGLTAKDIKRMGGVAGFTADADQVRRWILRQDDNARLVNVGRGLYAIEVDTVGGARSFVQSADNPGQPFLLDWNSR